MCKLGWHPLTPTVGKDLINIDSLLKKNGVKSVNVSKVYLGNKGGVETPMGLIGFHLSLVNAEDHLTDYTLLYNYIFIAEWFHSFIYILSVYNY